MFKKFFLSLTLAVATSPVFATTLYLQYPSSNGGNTTWSTSIGTDTVKTDGSSGGAATFRRVGTTYSLNSNVYFDISDLSASATDNIGSSTDTIDLNGYTFTVNGSPGAGVTFRGQVSNVSGSSSSSILLQNAILLLGNSAQIGSPGRSVPITLNDSNSTIQLLSGGATCSLTPYFLSSSQQTLNIDTNGGTLNIYGNGGNTWDGSLNVNDITGNGTLNLYGQQTGGTGGNDYASTNVTVVSGNLNLQLYNTIDNPYASQSIGNITMTGGYLTGKYFAGDVTTSGRSFFSVVGSVNSITMFDASIISPPATPAGNYGNLSW